MRFARCTVFLLLLVVAPALACIWDTDTIDDEIRGIPEAAVLVTGRWFRHGTAYYQDRVNKLGDKSELTLDEYDDLAVAYERLKRREEALAVLERKRAQLEKTPDEDHLYRYYANKGTILAHSGMYDEAVAELEKAIELNPDAHFGRERYQIDLIKYVAAAKQNPALWSEYNFLAYAGYDSGFCHSSAGQGSFTGYKESSINDTAAGAFQATAGMLRFGGLEGPELYRALGDICVGEMDLNLAWYFYMKAVEKEHPAQEQIKKSIEAIEHHWKRAGYGNPPHRVDFELTQQNAEQWLQAFQKAEAEAPEVQPDSASTSCLFIIVPVKSSICCEIFPILLKNVQSHRDKMPFAICQGTVRSDFWREARIPTWKRTSLRPIKWFRSLGCNALTGHPGWELSVS